MYIYIYEDWRYSCTDAVVVAFDNNFNNILNKQNPYIDGLVHSCYKLQN